MRRRQETSRCSNTRSRHGRCYLLSVSSHLVFHAAGKPLTSKYSPYLAFDPCMTNWLNILQGRFYHEPCTTHSSSRVRLSHVAFKRFHNVGLYLEVGGQLRIALRSTSITRKVSNHAYPWLKAEALDGPHGRRRRETRNRIVVGRMRVIPRVSEVLASTIGGLLP